MLLRIIIFLVLNFGALALGSFFTGGGVTSDWYNALNKAPWTPPGWVFGVAWTSIMLCFTIYMAVLFPKVNSKQKLIAFFAIQWLLNVSWNPAFFKFQQPVVAFAIMLALVAIVGYFQFNFLKTMRYWSFLILPYFVWLLIAASLNAYVIAFN